MQKNRFKKSKAPALPKLSSDHAILTEKSSFETKEAYKALRTNILHILGKDEKNTIVITSPYAAAGKTTTTVNLAITFSQLDKKILLVDADMRKPVINKHFSLPLSPGLADFLSGKDETFKALETTYKNLYVLPAGTIPANPTELLHSEKFDEFLAKASEEFDFVFIDTPPINIVTDAVIIGGKVAGTVLVARQNYTAKDSFNFAIKSLRMVEANILGYVLNAVNYDKYSYRYGHYYGRYGSKYKKYYGGKYSYKYGYGYGYGHKYGYGQEPGRTEN